MKRGKPLERRTPLERGKPPKRGKPIAKKGPKERRDRVFARAYGSAEHVECVKARGCEVARVLRARGRSYRHSQLECWRTLDAAHVVARGMGSAKGGARDLVCLCRRHREEAGEAGTDARRAFEQRWGLGLRALADAIVLALLGPAPAGHEVADDDGERS